MRDVFVLKVLALLFSNAWKRGQIPETLFRPTKLNVALTTTSTASTERAFSQYTTLNDHCRETNILCSTGNVGHYINDHINIAFEVLSSDDRRGMSLECRYCSYVHEQQHLTIYVHYSQNKYRLTKSLARL